MVEQKIESESLKKIAFKEAWKGRTRALWSIAAMGVVAGALIGLAVPFIPAIVGMLMPSLGITSTFSSALSAVPASMAIFSAHGMGIGALVGGILGGPSGCVGAVAEELQKRKASKEKSCDKTTSANIPVEHKEKPKHRYINPKVMALFAGLGAIGGAIMVASLAATGGLTVAAASALMPGVETALGAGATAGAVGTYVIGVMTSFGAIFGFNGPEIATGMQNFTGRLFSGELLGTSWEKKKSNGIQNTETLVASVNAPKISLVEEHSTSSHVSKLGNRETFSSYSDMIIKSAYDTKTSEQVHHK
ncbi:MAG: hypothetical protein AABY33_01215 [Pseudomonadota bacterium]